MVELSPSLAMKDAADAYSLAIYFARLATFWEHSLARVCKCDKKHEAAGSGRQKQRKFFVNV